MKYVTEGVTELFTTLTICLISREEDNELVTLENSSWVRAHCLGFDSR